VDPYLLVFYRWGSEIGLNMKEKYPKYTALVENLVQLAPVKSTLEIEEIESTL
jgi:glutathione S-transferase